MKTMKFKCELLSDIILNQKFATEGPNQTLDFIPGNNFLGIVAGKLYGTENTWNIFHSGKVRFGDAHPANGKNRTIRIPASFYLPKLQQKESDENKEYFIHHLIPDLQSDDLLKKQLKQCRAGFYDFTQKQAVQVKVDTDFAIKSAYDRNKRRSKDEQMYGYQCISKGLTYFFSVEIDDESLEDKIKEALMGIKRVGRSRSAQYGLVEISLAEYNEPVSSGKQSDELVIYADGRLIFLDEHGLPSFQPTNEQLGLPKDSVIQWDKSQIRTFRYSPYNFKRKCFDTDRCGLEKGSVLVIKLNEPVELNSFSGYIGSYQTEGFGKVIYNPEFLRTDDSEGKAEYRPCSVMDKKGDLDNNQELNRNNILLNYLITRKLEEELVLKSYKKVNEWVKTYFSLFKDKTFASQWGQIRSIAMRCATKDEMLLRLFDSADAYLSHGVAEEKWKEYRRKDKLRDFIITLNDAEVQMVMVNLAAEMAKKCREGGKNE